MTNKVYYAFNAVEMDDILFSRDMELDCIIDDIVDVIGNDIWQYDSFGHFVEGSSIGQIDWSNREMMYRIAEDLTEAFGEEIVVVVDYGDE